MKWMSEAQIPQAQVRTRISPGPGVGSGTSRTSNLPPRSTAARMTSTSHYLRVIVHRKYRRIKHALATGVDGGRTRL
jgi:hypothetical protein